MVKPPKNGLVRIGVARLRQSWLVLPESLVLSAVRAAFAAVCSDYYNVTVKPRAEPIRWVAAVNGGRARCSYPLARLCESSEPTPTLVGRKRVWFDVTSRASEGDAADFSAVRWSMEIPCKKEERRRASSSRLSGSEIVTELKMGQQ